jgi:UMF1 family MFS transporter
MKYWTAPGAHLAADGGKCASRLGQLSWALFEGGRNPYVLLVTIYIFAPYFTSAVVGDPTNGQALLNLANSIAGFAVCMLAPLLGAIADSGLRRKPWIAGTVAVMAPAAFALWWAHPGDGGIGIVGVLIVIAIVGAAFEFNAMFHNAMLPSIAPHNRIGALSGLGLALGNASGVLLLILMLIGFSLPGIVDWPFVAREPWFGLDKTSHEDARIAGPIAAVYMTLFLIPLLLFTPDRAKTGVTVAQAVRQGIGRLWNTIRSLREYKNTGLYLLARAIYNDGKTAILINGGVYAAGTFKWGVLEMLVYGVTLSIFATFGGVFGGWLDDRFGSRNAILISIGSTALILLASLGMNPTTILHVIPYIPPADENVFGLPFFKTWPELIYIAIVILIAISITAAYANSRTMLARIAPPEKMTEFFGIYALSGSSITWLASATVAFFTWAFTSQQAGMLSILLFLIPGFLLMLWVKDKSPS